jgi:hypothetical protein
VIDALLVAQKFSELPIRGKWESYISKVVDNPFPGIDRALVIAGSDMRGTIYGLYDVSEQIGVSPWWWFADVPVKKSEGVWALEGRKTQRSPSVKYRGFFINDEQPALTNWIKYVNRPFLGRNANLLAAIIMLLVLMVLDSITTSMLMFLSYCSDSKLITFGQLSGPACSTWTILPTSL